MPRAVRARYEAAVWWWLASVAFAVPPSVEVGEDGVVGKVTIAVAPDAVRARLADPAWVNTVEGGGTEVREVRPREGGCVEADYTSPSLFLTVRYTVRQCPTPAGVKSTLVTSNAFDAYEAEWSVAPDGDGALLTYRLLLRTNLALPASFVTPTLRKRVLHLMERMATHHGLGAP